MQSRDHNHTINTPLRRRKSRLPLGYRHRQTDSPARQRLRAERVRGSLIRTAFREYATGVWTVAQMRDWLEREGLRGRHGQILTTVQVTDLLRDRRYLGGPGWDALIDELNFDAVQDILDYQTDALSSSEPTT